MGTVLFFCKSEKEDNDLPTFLFLPEFGVITPEYGVPMAEYRIDGRVEDNLGQPLTGIEVDFQNQLEYSDASGNWAITTHAFYPCDPECRVIFRDIDGVDNGGEFTEQTINLNLTQTATSSGTYDLGTYEEHNIITILDPTL